MFGNLFEKVGEGVGEIIRAPIDIVQGIGDGLSGESKDKDE